MSFSDKVTALAVRIAGEVNTVRDELSDVATGRLPTAGGTMSGEIDMGFNKIVGLATPEWEQDAANKQYVDDEAARRLSVYGGTMQGEIDMNSFNIKTLNDPISPQDAATKAYVDAAVAGGGSGVSFLPTTGGTLSGGLNIDDGLGFAWEVSPGVGTMTITDGSGGNFEAGVGIVSVVDGSTFGGAMMVGGTVSIYADIREQLAAVPTQPYHAVTKQYIDTLVGNEAPDYVSEFEAALAS